MTSTSVSNSVLAIRPCSRQHPGASEHLADKGTDALPAFDQARVGQVAQGSTHGDARDAELVAQRLFGRQRVAGRECTPGDLVVQHQEQLSVQRHPGAPSRSAAGRKSCTLIRCFRHTDTRFLRLNW